MSSPTFRNVIAECRRTVPPPRELGWLAQKQLAPSPPDWMKDDPLRLIYAHYPRLLREGQIVWAHLVQANKLLFEPGKYDSPANALYSFDPYFDERPQELATIARSLYGAKGQQVADPELQKFGDELADEMKRTFALPVPLSLSGDRQTVFTTIMVIRKHLPQGYLAAGVFPLLVLPDMITSIILPSRFWPPALVQLWAR